MNDEAAYENDGAAYENDEPQVTYRPAHHRPWLRAGLVALGTAGVVGAALVAGWRADGGWAGPAAVGALLTLAGLAALRTAAPLVRADAHGVHHRRLLRLRSERWRDIAVIRVHREYPRSRRPGRSRVSLVFRDGREGFLPVPWSKPSTEPVFVTTVAALRALHGRYGTPDPDLPLFVTPEVLPHLPGPLIPRFRAVRVRPPGDTGAEDRADRADGKEVFLSARFLDPTDYNPYLFGTHIVLGGGAPMAVSPHPGPGRFGVRRVPVERLTLLCVRHVRYDEGGHGTPLTWQVAELNDAGTPVRLIASPANLARILRVLRHTSDGTAPSDGDAVTGGEAPAS